MNPTDDELEQQLRMLQPAEVSPTLKQGIRRQLARERIWRRMGWLAALVLITAVVLPVVWPFGQTSALAQALEAAQEAAAQVKTMHATITTIIDAKSQTFHAWYKRPNRSREESPNGTVTVDDGIRDVTWDPRSRKIVKTQESHQLDASLPESLRVGQLQDLRGLFKKLEGRGTLTTTGPTIETVDRQVYGRYEAKFAPAPDTGEGLKPFTMVLWFSKSDGLVRRVTRQTGGIPPVDISIAYDVDAPDDLFVIPADLTAPPAEPAAPPPPELVVTTVDEHDQPLANARVFFGNESHFDVYRSSADGRVTIPSQPDRLGQHWDRHSEHFVSSFLSNYRMVAESADGKLEDVFTAKGLYIVATRGFMEIDYGAKQWQLGQTHTSAGLQQHLQYDPASGRLSLRMKLLPKAVVVGRVLQSSGAAFGANHMYAVPLCLVRPLDEQQCFVSCTRMDKPILTQLKPGESFDMYGIYYFPCADDGSFRIEVPAGKPFILVFQPINTTPPLFPFTYPAKDPKTGRAMPLPQLAPGEVRNLGDIRAPAPDGP